MLAIQTPSARVAGGLSRRSLLAAGALSLLGLTLPDLLRAQARPAGAAAQERGFGRAKSCIIVLLKGGPSHLDTFDMKPEAPVEVRGEFRAVPTSVPGLRFCEHVPRLGKVADKLCIVRSMRLSGDAAHSTAAYEMTTGRRFPRSGEAVSTRDDHPHFGSVVSAAAGREAPAPPFVMLPEYLVVNGELRGGQNAGLLGARHDPFIPGGGTARLRLDSPGAAGLDLGLSPRVPASRLEDRVRLLGALESHCRAMEQTADAAALDAFRGKALSILTRGETRRAFDLESEPAASRERYGSGTFGRSVLLARRLVEAGVRLVQVNCMSSVLSADRNWDTHKDNFRTLKDVLLPPMDAAVGSLVEDLAASGLLDETLLVVLGEFGRTPKVNENAGRDHWPGCFSVVLAGAGLPRGAAFGASDKHGAYPTDRPVSPGQLAATVFHALGVDPALELKTIDGRPYAVCEEKPVVELWGSA